MGLSGGEICHKPPALRALVSGEEKWDAHHVEELLKQVLGGLALAPQHLVEVGIADALLEHLLQAHRHVGLLAEPHHMLLSPQPT